MMPINLNQIQQDSGTAKQKLHMALVSLDNKSRIVIPKKVRDRAGIIEENAHLLMFAFDNMVLLQKTDLNELLVLDRITGLRPTAFCPMSRPNNLRELVICLLADRHGMTLRQIHLAIRRSRGKISYQAVWKLVYGMTQDGQIKRVPHNKYVINPLWIKGLRSFCNIIEQNHKNFQIDEEVIACQK